MPATAILCLVCLALLGWVLLLKFELASLQDEVSKLRDPTPRDDGPTRVATHQTGLKSFTIDS